MVDCFIISDAYYFKNVLSKTDFTLLVNTYLPWILERLTEVALALENISKSEISLVVSDCETYK